MSAFNIQLAAYGEQDFYLTGNPDISFFKKIYRRHTHFAKELVNIQFTKDGGVSNFDHHFQAPLLKKGELLSNLYLELDLDCKQTTKGTTTYTVNHFLNSLIKNASIKIGSTVIEKYISQWKQAKYELTHPKTKHYTKSSDNGGLQTEFDFNSTTYNDNIISTFSQEDILAGNNPILVGGGEMTNNESHTEDSTDLLTKKLLYTFDFWFTRNIGMALPIICLKDHEVLLEFDTESKEELIGSNEINIDDFILKNIKLRGEYIHLYGDEKRKFTNNAHEYLIEQLQYKDNLSTSDTINGSNKLVKNSYNLNSLKHPVKYMAWVVQNKGTPMNNKGMGPCYFTSLTTSNLYGKDGNDGTANIKFNGVSRTQELPMIYFTRLYPQQVCNNIPSLDRIGFYSFCIKPFEHQPSGTCNMSKIRDKTIELEIANRKLETIKNKKLFIFAVNYNVFRVSHGISGLLFV